MEDCAIFCNECGKELSANEYHFIENKSCSKCEKDIGENQLSDYEIDTSLINKPIKGKIECIWVRLI